MKGGVALALVGLLAVILGVKGTAGDVWKAATGGGAAAGSSTAGSNPAATRAAIPSAASVVPNIGAAPGQPGNPAVQM